MYLSKVYENQQKINGELGVNEPDLLIRRDEKKPPREAESERERERAREREG